MSANVQPDSRRNRTARAPVLARLAAAAWLAAAVLLLAGRAPAATAFDRLLDQLEPRGAVNDFAGVFDPATKSGLEARLTELEQKTRDAVVVVAVKSLAGGDVNDFASRLYAKWGIGQRGGNRGALLLAAIEDRKARIEVGYGLEGLIPDARAGRILDEAVIPFFRQGQYGQGLAAGAASLADIVARDRGVTLNAGPAPAPPPPAPSTSPAVTAFVMVWFALAIVLIVLGRFRVIGTGVSRGGYFGGGGGFGGFGGGSSGGGGASRGW